MRWLCRWALHPALSAEFMLTKRTWTVKGKNPIDSFWSDLGGVVLGPRGPEDVHDAVVCLVTCVLKDRTVTLHHRNRCGPRSGKGRRIVHCNFIVDCVVVDTREAFDQMQVRRFGKSIWNAETGYIVITEVGHIDDEGIPFPMASRVPHPLMYARVDVRPAIERDDTSLVHHLLKQSHASWTLHH